MQRTTITLIAAGAAAVAAGVIGFVFPLVAPLAVTLIVLGVTVALTPTRAIDVLGTLRTNRFAGAGVLSLIASSAALGGLLFPLPWPVGLWGGRIFFAFAFLAAAHVGYAASKRTVEEQKAAPRHDGWLIGAGVLAACTVLGLVASTAAPIIDLRPAIDKVDQLTSGDPFGGFGPPTTDSAGPTIIPEAKSFEEAVGRALDAEALSVTPLSTEDGAFLVVEVASGSTAPPLGESLYIEWDGVQEGIFWQATSDTEWLVKLLAPVEAPDLGALTLAGAIAQVVGLDPATVTIEAETASLIRVQLTEGALGAGAAGAIYDLGPHGRWQVYSIGNSGFFELVPATGEEN